MKLKQFIKTAKSYTIIGLITLIFLEIALQVSHLKPLQNLPGFNTLYKSSNIDESSKRVCDSDWWKSQFINWYEENRNLAIYDERLHDPHPTRGWTPRPNLSVKIGDNHYTTNQRGHRALKDYQSDPDKYTVLIVGDSYTFGIDGDDSFIWTNLLQNQQETLNIINLGVGGYGLDQMYITLIETIEIYQPDLVIAAFIADDLFRMRLNFRDYKKPQLKIQNNDLTITNIPIGDLEQTYEEAQQDLKWRTIPFIKFDDAIDNLLISCHKVNYDLVSKVLLEMQAISYREDADFLLVYLADTPEYYHADYNSRGEEVFQRFVRENSVNYLNTRPAFLQGNREGQNYTGGHYQEVESRLVADLIYDRMEKLESFQNFIADSIPKPK